MTQYIDPAVVSARLRQANQRQLAEVIRELPKNAEDKGALIDENE